MILTVVLCPIETYLVDKVQQKVDEKLGRVETNEFVIMADIPKPTVAVVDKEEQQDDTKKPNAQATESASREPPSSVFASKVTPALPFFQSPTSQRPVSKADYQQQLEQLRQRQARVRQERSDPSSFRSVEDIDQEIKRIDQQKAHLKQLMKKL